MIPATPIAIVAPAVILPSAAPFKRISDALDLEMLLLASIIRAIPEPPETVPTSDEGSEV